MAMEGVSQTMHRLMYGSISRPTREALVLGISFGVVNQ
jgi:hypothetical protein